MFIYHYPVLHLWTDLRYARNSCAARRVEGDAVLSYFCDPAR